MASTIITSLIITANPLSADTDTMLSFISDLAFNQ